MAKPIVDMFSWNAPDNSLQALYEYYLGGGDEDAGGGGTGGGGTGGITNAYVGGDGGANLQYNEMQTMTPRSDDVNYLTYDPNINYSRVPGPFDYMQEDPSTGEKLGPSTLAEAIVGDRGLKTIRKRDDEENLDPEWLKKIKSSPLYKTVKPYAPALAAQMMGGSMFGAPLAFQAAMRPDATESAAGIAGLYASEANLLGDLQQAGLLVDAGNQGMKTITGKNVVSLMGGYEEGQQEIYDKFVNKHGSDDEVEDWFQNVYAKKVSGDVTKSFKYKQWQESKFNNDRTDIMTANTIKNMRKQIYDPTYTARHPSDIAKDAPDITPKTVEDTAASEDAYTPSSTPHPGLYTPIHSADPPSGGHPGSAKSREMSDPFNKGGLIRKKYGNGGIVDLL